MTPRHDIKSVRAHALGLHKKLIDATRTRYEAAHGRIDPGEMMRLVAFDPEFAWLHPLSRLIFGIKDRLEQPELTEIDAAEVRWELERVFSGSGGEPPRQFDWAQA